MGAAHRVATRSALRGFRTSGTTYVNKIPPDILPQNSVYNDWLNYGHQAPGVVRKVFAAPIAGLRLRWQPRGTSMLPWWSAVTLLVAPIAVADFDYRYLIPVIPFAAMAAGLAFAPRQDTGKDTSSQSEAEVEPTVLRGN